MMMGAGEETIRWEVYGLLLPSLYGNAKHFSHVQDSPGDEIHQERETTWYWDASRAVCSKRSTNDLLAAPRRAASSKLMVTSCRLSTVTTPSVQARCLQKSKFKNIAAVMKSWQMDAPIEDVAKPETDRPACQPNNLE